MSKKNKKPDFSQMRIFILVGAIGAALSTAVLALLWFTTNRQVSKKSEDPDPDPGQDEPVKTE